MTYSVRCYSIMPRRVSLSSVGLKKAGLGDNELLKRLKKYRTYCMFLSRNFFIIIVVILIFLLAARLISEQ
jgi:hypothetical protein